MTCDHTEGARERASGGRTSSSAGTVKPLRGGGGSRAAGTPSSRAPVIPGLDAGSSRPKRYTAGVVQLLRLVAVLTLLFLLLPLLDVRVRGRTNRARYVQIVIVSILLLGFLLFGRRWT